MQIDIRGTANLSQMQRQFAIVQEQVAALNKEMAATSMRPTGGSAAGYRRLAAGANAANNAFNSAVASSGAFQVQQVKINDAVARNTELLARQKLGISQVFGKKSKDMMHAIYREQLAMQAAQTKVTSGLIGDGKTRMTMMIPSEVPKSWDTMNAKVGMFRARLASASSELVNWGKNTQWAGRQLMAGISMPVAAFGAVAGILAYQTDKAMAKIVKVYDFTESAQKNAKIREQEVGDLRNKSLEMATNLAKNYGSSLSSTLDVAQQLAATGLVGQNLLNTTKEVQRIATLGDIDPTKTVDMVISLQTAFKDTIHGSADLTKTLNFMNAAANATSLSLDDIATATPRAATGIAQLGGTAEEMTILLVSMREAGVNAASGANALKSATTRIISPVSKATKFYDQFGISLQKIAQQSGGNLFEYLKILGEEQQKINGKNEKQTALLRAQGVAALFGTYQNNRLTASLVNMADAYGGVENQSKKAMDLMGLSSEELAKRAGNSMKDVTETASGQFKRALETMKAELQDMGKPFLEVATWFVKGVSAVVSFINNMPSWAKKGLIFAAMLGAIVGPVVMLIGLFANFAGNIGKFAAMLLRSVTSFQVMDKAQWASKVSSDLAAKGFVSEASATEMLTSSVSALTQGLQAYGVELARIGHMKMPVGVGGSMRPANQVYGVGQYASPIGPQPNTRQHTRFSPQAMPTQSSFVPTAIPTHGARASDLLLRQRTQERIARIEAERLRTQVAVNNQANAEAAIRDKTLKSVTGAKVAGAAMAVSMTAMMLPLGEGANKMAMMAMAGSIIVPMFVGMGKALTVAIGKAQTFYALQKGIALEAGAASLATGKAAGKMGVLRGAAGGLRAGMLSIMGPVGWTLTAIAAIGAGLYMMHQKEQEIWKQRVDANQSLIDSTKIWAKGAADVAGEYAKIEHVATGIPNSNDFKEIVAGYSANGDAADAGATFHGLAPNQQDLQAQKMFVDLQVKSGLTAVQARENITALYVATGSSAFDAAQKTQVLLDEIGSIKDIDWAPQVETQFLIFTSNLKEYLNNNKNDEIVTQNAAGLAEVWSAGWAAADNKIDSTNMLNQLKNAALAAWDDTFMALQSSGEGQAFLDKFGIKGAESLASYYHNAANAADDLNNAFVDPASAGSIRGMMDSASGVEEHVIGAAAAYRQMGTDIKTAAQFQNEFEISSKQMNYKQGLEYAKQMRIDGEAYAEAQANGASPLVLAAMGNVSDKIALARINQLNLNQGFKQAETLSGALFNYWNRIPAKIQQSVSAIKMSVNEMSSGALNFQFDKADAFGIKKAGMEGVMNEVADTISSGFDTSMQTAIDANSATWDNAISAMENHQQNASDRLDRKQSNQSDAFDARWTKRTDRVTAYYDKRIEMVGKEIEAEQKAEEIRQAIFEAEQTRLDRLTESANRGIDFNMAIQTGNLDEAAKIRNDMNAAAQGWALADAGGAGASASERRQARLGKKSDSLGKQKDEALKALKMREDEQKKSLERQQENEKKHLQKMQQMQSDALKAEADADNASLKAQWEADKELQQAKLETAKAFVPKNKKQLEEWLATMGLSYKDFGKNTLHPTSQTWGQWFQDSFQDHIRDAGVTIASDHMWERLGKSSAKDILSGMGFNSMAKFKKFVETGVLPTDFGQPKKVKDTSTTGSHGSPMTPVGGSATDATGGAGAQFHHTGGIAGVTAGSRNGIARTAPLQKSEVPTILRKGEFVINKKSSQKHGALLNAVNNGTLDTASGNVVGGAGAPGVTGIVAGILGRMMASGVGLSMKNAYSNNKGKTKPNSAEASAGYVPGSGSRSAPIRGYGHRDIHDEWTTYPAVDFAAPTGTSVYAVGNGIITRSYDIPGPLATDTYKGDGPYGSYGRVVYLKTDAGPEVLMAHLSSRFVSAGQRVTGGSKIGAVGNTGNSSGSHLHFGAKGASPLSFLKNGGMTINDGMAMLHRGETVLTQPLTEDLKNTVKAFGKISTAKGNFASTGMDNRAMNINVGGLANLHTGGMSNNVASRARQGVDNFASGGNSEYNVNVYVTNPNADADEIAQKVMQTMKRIESRKPTRRRS